MQNKWNNKKKTGNFSADGLSSMSDWIKKQQDKLSNSSYSVNNDDEEQESDTKLSDILNKYYAGGDLTDDEMEYLQKKNPLMYRQIKANEAETKNYENELKHCRTKDEVQQVRMNHTAASLSAVNSIKNNPNITQGTKLGLMSAENRKLKEMGKITVKFVQSGEYAKLPTENEKLKAEKELKEAEEFERTEAAKAEESAENAESTKESAEITSETTKEVSSDNVTEETSDEPKIKAEEAEQTEHEIKLSQEERSDAKDVTESDRKTRTEAEQTPEARKVKHAKAKVYLASPTELSGGAIGGNFVGKA
jgi:hypothetical protein